MKRKIQTIQDNPSFEDPPDNRSHSRKLTSKEQSLSTKGQIAIILLALFTTASAQTQVRLSSAQLQLENSQVSRVSNGTLSMFRENSGPAWQTNQCFQLFIQSPYLNTDNATYSDVYQTFSYSSPPTCISLTPGIVVANCSMMASDTLSFSFQSVAASVAFSQTILVQITQIKLPFSSQLIRTINLRYYTDAICSSGQKTANIPAITTQIAILPVSRINLTSTSNILGNSTTSNSLIIKFTPLTTMCPTGAGLIQIGLPNWYQIGSTSVGMYNPNALNKCSSPCMRIFYSKLSLSQTIDISYNNMDQSCISGAEITVTCRQFYNPIRPEMISNFSLSILDDSPNPRVIEQTIADLQFDATQFLPATIPLKNFKISPSDNTVSTYSPWTIAISVNIPLEKECYIRFYLPAEFVYRPIDMQASGIFIKPDLERVVNLSDIQVIYRTANGSIPKSSVVFPGCNEISLLGLEPAGSIYISDISTPNSIMDSNTFDVTIYKDKQLTKKLAVLEQGAILSSSNMSPGSITNIIITPADSRVQRVTNIKISFTTSHFLDVGAGCQITLPLGLSIPNQAQLIVTLSNGTSITPKVTNNQTIFIPNLASPNQNITAYSNVSFTINGIKNQISAQDAGPFSIQTMQFFKGSYYVVDQQNVNMSYTATVGKIIPVGNVVVNNPANSARGAVYNISFVVEDQVPISGQIRVTIPSEITLQPSSTASFGSCRIYQCTKIDSNSVQLLFSNGIAAGQQVTLTIGGAINPRSFQPTGQFTVTSIDIDGVTPIDTGYNQTTVMTIAGLMNSFTAAPQSNVNGAVNTYQFSSQNGIPIVAGDQLQITLPAEILAPLNSSQMNCTTLINVSKITCAVSGQTMTIIFNQLASGVAAFAFTISGIKNPPSTQQSNAIASRFLDNNGYIVSANSDIQNPVRITNSQPANLVVYGINQASIISSQITTYYISFTPVNALGVQSSINIQYPSQVQLQVGQTTCVVQTTIGTYSTNCVIQETQRSITIQNIIPGPAAYSGPINVTVTSVKNPANNRPTNGFIIQTYADQALTFIQDRLGDFLLQPQFPCNYPCETCGTDKSVCNTCWQTEGDPNFLMFYPNGTITCKPYCDSGFTTNGNSAKNCTACDVSCATCVDNQTQGDMNLCTNCAATYPFRLSQTQTCLQQCKLGQFISAANTCAQCKDPCQGCAGSERQCTQCFQNRTGFPSNLYFGGCIDVCPVGYISMNGICVKCRSPCQTCTGSPDNCDSCDGSGNTKFIYQKRCYAQCPAGSAPNSTDQTCLTCNQGCDLCDIVNITKCLKCTKPTVAYQGDCLDACPDGWHIDIPPNDGRACRPWQLGDLGTLPYPFLIAALIFTIICLFGLLKKRAFLSHGKMQMISPQNTLTCVIVAIAPLQFLATIAQWILSYVYGTSIFTILALIVTIAAIIINFAFQISFYKRFDTVVIPMSYERRVRLGKMTRSEAKKYQVPRDENFNLFQRQNKGTAYTIYSATLGLTWKFNKLFYSFFYDLKIFQAQFTNAKFYRKMMTTYYVIGVICVDLTLICIDITALTKIEPGNQLYITLQETLILSILNIILGSIELFNIKSSLQYTEIKKQSKLKIKSGGEDSEDSYNYKDLDAKFDKGKMTERRLLMNDLLKHVKHNKQLFLNNKLDELLQDFGERKCKSMLDLGTGWNLEDDPRLAITWPVSPMLKEDFAEMADFKFTKDDAYGLQGNNVYADAKSKFMGMDFGIQEDAGFLEFQDALNRKHGGLMSQQEGEVEERRIKKQKRRRGRKNKYYTQIDHEDDQEAENAEANDAKDTLKVIKEQEEEEEMLRKAIAEEAVKHLEQANQRKKLLDEANQAKQAQEVKEAQERKQKAIDIENASKAKIQAEAELLAKQAIQSKKLQEQYAIEIKQRQAEEKLKAEQAALQSAKQREEYDRQDASRLRRLNEEKAKLQDEEEAQNKVQLELDRIEREQKIKDALQAQAERDARELQENLERTKAIDAERAINKSRVKPGLEQPRVKSPVKAESNTQSIDVPPNPHARTFNECDILGDLDRDEKGNVIVLKDINGVYQDKSGNLTNQRGYLLNSITQAVVENLAHQEMFAKSQLDSKGEIPAPFCIEKFNFNPHNLVGDFDFIEGQRQLLKSSQGFYMDKNGRRVNKFGWLTLAGQGHLVDVSGRKKFDKTQLQPDGNLQKLFNYQGKRFDIQDVMGVIGKDQNGKICPQSSSQGSVDLLGRRVSDKGYLTDAAGNIIDQTGKQIWRNCELKNGEFPKIFTFTKFNIKQIQGDFEIGPHNNPTLAKGAQGGFVDRQKRPTNQRGYFVDKQGNLIDQSGNLVFYNEVLGQDGEIPPVFRTGVLTTDVVSDLSNMIAEFEQDRLKGIEISQDSQMDDMPLNYDNANSGFGNGELISDQDDYLNNDLQSNGAQTTQNKKKSKKKAKVTKIEILQPTVRDKNLAGAYGGEAVGSIRRQGVKYDKERLKGSQKFRVSTADEPKLRTAVAQFVQSPSNSQMMDMGIARKTIGDEPFVQHQGFLGETIQQLSNDGKQTAIKKGADQVAQIDQERTKQRKPGMQDFEQIFGKDIDQFLEESQWDLRSQDNVSQGSGKNNPATANSKRMKQLEKQYSKASPK